MDIMPILLVFVLSLVPQQLMDKIPPLNVNLPALLAMLKGLFVWLNVAMVCGDKT
jgi:hypothetical protein